MSNETEDQVHRGSSNIFADLGYADAATHKLKAELVQRIRVIVKDRELTQASAGELMGLSQPDVSRLFKGQFRDVSVERLMKMLTRLNSEIEITVSHAGKHVGDSIHMGQMAVA